MIQLVILSVVIIACIAYIIHIYKIGFSRKKYEIEVSKHTFYCGARFGMVCVILFVFLIELLSLII